VGEHFGIFVPLARQSKPEAWLKLACALGLAVLGVIAITLAPAVVPPLAVTLLGDRARGALDALSAFCGRHSRAINASVCFGFAIFLAGVSLPVVL